MLTLPQLVISAQGVASRVSTAVGPDIGEDGEQAPEVVSACLASAGFAEFSLLLLGNLYLTSQGKPGRSWAGRDCDYLIQGLAEYLKSCLICHNDL